MRKVVLLFFLMSITLSGKAQTFSEFFRQKKAQKKYLTQQLAALQVYLEYSRKGYSITQNGLATIGKFKRREFDLHAEHFSALKNVNPHIRRGSKVAHMIALQVNMIKMHGRSVRDMQQSKALRNDEQAYVGSVFSRLFESCGEILDALMVLSKEGALEMSDDQRLARMDVLYRQMVDNSLFCQKFSQETDGLIRARRNDQKEVQLSKAFHGIKNEEK